MDSLTHESARLPSAVPQRRPTHGQSASSPMKPNNSQQTVMLAYNKRKAQLDRWRDSDTEKESLEIKNRPKRVKFADKCIFQAACAANDKAQVAKMIKEGYDINAVDEDGITALHQACIEDNLDMVEFLLKHGADVNISDNEGWTPLHAVATCCYVSIAKLLLEHGANVIALNNDCSIPLDICKSDEIREIFIRDINTKGIDLKEARRGEELRMIEDAKRWLHSGHSEDPHPITGATALHVAACKGYIKVLDQIIKAGANINVKDFDGWSPLHAAAHWGQKEACELLLENNCDIEIKDYNGQMALDIADRSVLPVFEQFKRKRDINKNVELNPNSIQNTHVGPIIQIQRKIIETPVKVEEVKIFPPPPVSIKDATETHPAPSEEVPKSQEKVPVRRTKGDLVSANDTSLRRAYSFESDPKFYTRLRDARNRIKASNSSSPSTNTAILEHIPTLTSSSDNLIHNAQLSSLNAITSINKPVTDSTPCALPLTTSKLQEGFEETPVLHFTHKRNKESEPVNATSTASSPSLSNHGSQSDVKVRRSFVPPTRDEESETQRKANAKRVRETRRSTQGVTLEELKSAEQYVKNSLLGNATSTESTNTTTTTTPTNVPATTAVPRKEDEASVERRPSWRLRVDEQDPSKFSLEDTRTLPTLPKNTGVIDSSTVQRSSSLRSRASSNKNENVHGKPPKPPEGSESQTKALPEEEKEKDMKNSGAQGAILRKKKTKRRSTGIVQYNQDGSEITQAQAISGSDAEVGSGSGPSSDLEPTQDSSKSENGVTSINYKKLYEEVLKENQLLKGRVLKTEEDMADLKLKLERVSLTPRITSEDLDRREKRALERKLSEMEEELKESRHLRTENQKLRDENGALIRVISKLSK